MSIKHTDDSSARDGYRLSGRSGRGVPDEFVARCARVVPDIDEFMAAMTRPLGVAVRVNSLKAEPEEVFDLLADMRPERLPWWDSALALRNGSGIGLRLEHFMGLVYVQNAASMVPPLVLDPQPGERVLDMAAAPGSKTTQMAAMMNNQGLIIANDFSRGRVRGLIGNIDRVGCLNVCVCRMDGIKLARELTGSCDRVLVDAPCTCEGIMRRTASALDRWSLEAIRKFGRLQKGLVVTGYQALRPGGTLVYSTCTVAPEENEVVLAYLLERFPEAEVLPVELPGFMMRPALSGWDGVEFPAAVENARRILPQDNDTEAFFVARVRKPEEDRRRYRVRGTDTGRRKQDMAVIAGLAERFGIPDAAFAGFEAVVAQNQGTVFLATPEVMSFDAVRPMRRGMRFCRLFPRSVKPTTDALQLFGRQATRNFVELGREQVTSLIAEGQISVEADCEDGFVLVRCGGFPVGVGLYHRPVLKSQIPRYRPVTG